jgi:hypothetical protein
MISTLKQTVVPQMRRRTRCVTHAKQRSVLDFAEVVNGRASMYGVVFGGANWALTGLSITQQMGYTPFQVLGLASCGLVMLSMNNAVDKLNDKQFEDWATRDTGRVFMIIFALMTLYGLGSVPSHL